MKLEEIVGNPKSKCWYREHHHQAWREAMFHTWGSELAESETAFSYTVAIIENNCGQIKTILPENIAFKIPEEKETT